jgi:hypothetical protein
MSTFPERRAISKGGNRIGRGRDPDAIAFERRHRDLIPCSNTA